MTPYMIGFIFGVACFVVGFFVGGKHRERVMRAAGELKDTVGKW